MDQSLNPARWMKAVLIAAGIYNLLWGTIAVLLPEQSLGWLGFDPLPQYPQLWQCIGMIVGVCGLGYIVAANDPYVHWPIVLVGLLGKFLGPTGFLLGPDLGTPLPTSLAWTLLTNDLIWLVPFAVILWRAKRYASAASTVHVADEFDDPIRELFTNTGKNLDELSNDHPQLLVFLRHAGCTFCRESLSILSNQRADIDTEGCGIVLVHMGENERRDRVFFDKYGLSDVPRISDPTCRLYRQCGLDLGSFQELFGFRVWIRGFIAGYLNGHGIGRAQGNTFQMPGAFVVHNGEFVRGFRPTSAADPPDYLGLVKSSLLEQQQSVA